MKQRHSLRSDIIADVFESPLGTLYLFFAGKALVGIDFERPEGSFSRQVSRQSERFKVELEAYFQGSLKKFAQPVEFLDGTEFERSVWLCLKEVPYGETRSYKWLAESIGRPGAVRAVGQALGKNPIPIVIPCHRIIESDGSLGGYSGGIRIKRRLLGLEYYTRLQTMDQRP